MLSAGIVTSEQGTTYHGKPLANNPEAPARLRTRRLHTVTSIQVHLEGLCPVIERRTRIRLARYMGRGEDSHQHDLQSLTMSAGVTMNLECRSNVPCTADIARRSSNNAANNRPSAS